MLEKVRRDIEEHAFSIREHKLSELTTRAKVKYSKEKRLIYKLFNTYFASDFFGTCYITSGYHIINNLSSMLVQEKLRKALVEPVESLFDAASQTTWASIRNLYKRETEAILPEFLNTLCGFEMESEVSEGMVSKLRDYARSIVENKAKEEANKVLMHMKERLTNLLISCSLSNSI
jgi:hypothetical protein